MFTTASGSSSPLEPAARLSPYDPLLWPNTQPLSRKEFAHCCATLASVADNASGPAQCLARTRLCASTRACASLDTAGCLRGAGVAGLGAAGLGAAGADAWVTAGVASGGSGGWGWGGGGWPPEVWYIWPQPAHIAISIQYRM